MSFRRTLLTGLVVVLPIFITYWVIAFIVGALHRTVTPVLTQILRLLAPGEWLQQAWLNYIAPLVSVALAVAVIYLIGLVGGNVLGRQLLKTVEGLLLRIPIVRGIYSATRQFIDTFSRPQGSGFRGVVLIEFPREGSWSLAFLTGAPQGEVQEHAGQPLVSVFVPTTPNPTSGYLLFVPESRTVRLDITIDDALKMIISGGVLVPGSPPAVAKEGGPRRIA